MTNPNTGRFAWHELMTADPVAAGRFYADLLGWSVQEVDMGPTGVYRLFKHDGKDVGGCMQAPPGQPSAWLAYVGSDDVKATVAKIVEHHGRVLVPPTVVPGMVHFAITMDPQGAAVGVLESLGQNAGDSPPPPAPGTFCWDELYTSDRDAAGTFYSAVFGWTSKVGDDAMKYWHWLNQGKDIGGMLPLQMLGRPEVPPHWLAYLGVADVDASTRKAEEHGAKILMPAMDIPNVGKFAVLADPTGAVFALFRSART